MGTEDEQGSMMKIMVKAFYWHETDAATALSVIRHKFYNMVRMNAAERLEYLNRECLRGIRFTLEDVRIEQ